MRNTVVKGGTDGIGRALAVSCLRAGGRVLTLGRCEAKGTRRLLDLTHETLGNAAPGGSR